jgi:hypothetical protein
MSIPHRVRAWRRAWSARWLAGRGYKVNTPRRKEFSIEEARQIGERLGLDWSQVDLAQFCIGLHVEMEHGRMSPHTNVTDDDPLMTGKIALAHLNQYPDYYARLIRVCEEGEVPERLADGEG